MTTFAHSMLIVFGCVAVSAADCAAQNAAITTKPRFEQREQFVYLVIGETNQSYEIVWGMLPDVRFEPVSLDTNRVYTFTVTQRPYHTANYTDSIPELSRVQLDGQTIYDIEVCAVHKIKMQYKEVPIVYGFPVGPGLGEPTGDTEIRLFPHCREYSLGGCAFSSDSPKTKEIYVCADCKKAYNQWKLEHQKTK